MSYLVLARKWRPQIFDDLVGQPHIIKVLKGALSQKKVHHAYVFSGPRGVGKTTTARILAKSLNCINGPTPEPCGRCEFCISIADGSSMDVIEIDGASNNSVDDIREIRERVRYAPSVAGKYKVYIIDEAHMLSESAFNALLKTIEEPPPHTIFVLATTAYRKIPATVLSRCQHLSFRRIPRELIIERLRYIAGKEGIRVTDDGLDLIAKAADGSMRDSLTLLDQVSSFSDEITSKDVADLLGISDSKIILDLAEAIFDGDQKRLLSIIAEAVQRGADLRILYKDMILFLRDMLIIKNIQGSDLDIRSLFEFSREEIDSLKVFSNRVSSEELVLMINELLRGEQDIRNAVFPRIAFEINLIKISHFKEFSSLRETIEKLKYLNIKKEDTLNTELLQLPSQPSEEKKRLEGEIIQHDSSSIGSEKNFQKTSQQFLRKTQEEIISEFLRIIDERDHVLASKLAPAEINIQDDREGITTINLIFNGGHSFFVKSISEQKDLIQDIFKEIIGRPIKLKITSSEKKVSEKSADNFKKEVLSRPEVKEIIELFEGSVIEVRRIEENN